MAVISDEKIRERARHIWEREGRPDGRADEHWQMARTELAMEDDEAEKAASEPNPIAQTGRDYAIHDEPVESAVEAYENEGDFPNLRDQGEARQYPETPGPRKRGRRKVPPPHQE